MKTYTEQIVENISLKLGFIPGTKAFEASCDRFRPLSDVKSVRDAGGLRCGAVQTFDVTKDPRIDGDCKKNELDHVHSQVFQYPSGFAVSLHIDTGLREDGVEIDRGCAYLRDMSQTVDGIEDPSQTETVVMILDPDLASMEDLSLISDEQFLAEQDLDRIIDDIHDSWKHLCDWTEYGEDGEEYAFKDPSVWDLEQFEDYRAACLRVQEFVVNRPLPASSEGKRVEEISTLAMPQIDIYETNTWLVDQHGYDTERSNYISVDGNVKRRSKNPDRVHSLPSFKQLDQFRLAMMDAPEDLNRLIYLGGFTTRTKRVRLDWNSYTRPMRQKSERLANSLRYDEDPYVDEIVCGLRDPSDHVFGHHGFMSTRMFNGLQPAALQLSMMTVVPVEAGFNRAERRFKWFGRNLKLVGKDKPCKDTFQLPLSAVMAYLRSDLRDYDVHDEFTSINSLRPRAHAMVNWSGSEFHSSVKVSVYPLTALIGIAVATSSSGGRNVKRLWNCNQRRQTGKVIKQKKVRIPPEAIETFMHFSKGRTFIEAGAPEPVLNLSTYRLEALRRKVLNLALEEKPMLLILEQA